MYVLGSSGYIIYDIIDIRILIEISLLFLGE